MLITKHDKYSTEQSLNCKFVRFISPVVLTMVLISLSAADSLHLGLHICAFNEQPSRI